MPMKLLAAIGLCLALAAPAQAGPNDGFAAFWSVFAKAIAHDDTAALAPLVQLGPGLDQNDAHLTFAKFHAEYLKAPVRRCLAKAHPIIGHDETGAGEYTAFCGQLIYVFTKTPGGWKLTDISPDD